MKKFAGAGALLAALVLPLGCSGDPKSSGLPSLGDSSATGGPSTTTGVPSTPITTGPTSPSAGPPTSVGVHRRKVVAGTAEQQAVADAYLKYLTVRLTAYNKADVNLDELAKVASGQALTVVRAAVAQLQQKQHHTIGEIWVDVPTITVKGATATLKSCLDNTTIDVNEAGKAVEAPIPYYIVTGTLEKVGGTVWVAKNVAFAEQRCR